MQCVRCGAVDAALTTGTPLITNWSSWRPRVIDASRLSALRLGVLKCQLAMASLNQWLYCSRRAFPICAMKL